MATSDCGGGTGNYRNCRRSPLLTFPFREIPTVTSFPRNDKLLGRVRRLIRIGIIKTERTRTSPCHCEERKARRGNLPEGKTDESYTDVIPLPWGISPLRSGCCPHFGRNDIVKQRPSISPKESLNRLRTRTPPCHCEERNARRGNLPEGKTDESYTNVIPLPWGISPLRSDCRPHFGRNDIINQAYTNTPKPTVFTRVGATR